MTDPVKTEAQSDVGTFEFRGETFTVPLERVKWSVDLIESLEEGKAVGSVRGALGPAQWRTVRAMELNMGELGELSLLIAEAMGFSDAGESAPSSA